MKTTEGIQYWAFVDNPRTLSENPSLCGGLSIKEWLDRRFSSTCSFGLDNLRNGFYKLGGWCFDLRPFMKKYIYTYYDSIHSAYAPNVKGLRSAHNLRRSEKVALAPKGF